MLLLDSFVSFSESLYSRAGVTVHGAMINSVPHIVLDDHRWMLPAIWVANRTSAAQSDPPPLVLLDQHAELAHWDETYQAHREMQGAIGLGDVLNHCQMEGRPGSDKIVHDGNWLSAGVKLKWVGPVVNIGLVSADRNTDPPGIVECGRMDRRLFRRNAHWLQSHNRNVHTAIGWKILDDEITFSSPTRNLYLSVDLDAFAEGGEDGEGMMRWPKAKLVSNLASPYKIGMAKGHSFLETYRAWLEKTSFVLIAMETEMFIGYGQPRQRKRAESLLADFWNVFYGAAPKLEMLSK